MTTVACSVASISSTRLLTVFAVALIPAAYGTFLLFRTPAARISSVTRVPITREERRVAGGNRLTAKLKVRGSGLRPMLRASIDDVQSLGFVFEDPNSADVLVGEVPPGAHDLILYDGVQEVARLAKSVTIESSAPPRIAGVGTLVNMDKATADALASDPAYRAGSPRGVLKLGDATAQADGSWQRPLEIVLQCDPDPNGEGCAVGRRRAQRALAAGRSGLPVPWDPISRLRSRRSSRPRLRKRHARTSCSPVLRKS